MSITIPSKRPHILKYQGNAHFEKWESSEDEVKFILTDEQTREVSDGYHTFGELYDHRTLLFICLAIQTLQGGTKCCWKTHYPGWPVLFIETPAGQISYHFPEKYLPLVAKHIRQDDDYVWDGHTSKDVIARLTKCMEDEL